MFFLPPDGPFIFGDKRFSSPAFLFSDYILPVTFLLTPAPFRFHFIIFFFVEV